MAQHAEEIEGEAGLAESNERLRLRWPPGRWYLDARTARPAKDAVVSGIGIIFGLRPGEFPGTEAALYEYIHPEDGVGPAGV